MDTIYYEKEIALLTLFKLMGMSCNAWLKNLRNVCRDRAIRAFARVERKDASSGLAFERNAEAASVSPFRTAVCGFPFDDVSFSA